MNNLLKELAADPSCILALFPDNGGEWCSPIHTPQPRDFTKEYHWDKLHTALQSLPWENDYHFEFKFTVHDFDTGSRWIMYQSAGRIVFSIEKDGRGCRFVFGSYSFTDSAPIYTSFVPSLTGEHVVTVAVAGSTFKVTVDGTPYEKSGERVASSEYDRAIMTVAPVSIHSITLTDDTVSTALWSAGYDELYDTNIPTPSSIPRNFADENVQFSDSFVMQDSIGSDDFTLQVRCESLDASRNGHIIIGCLITPHWGSTAGYQPYVTILQSDGTIGALYPVGTTHVIGVAKIQVIKRGGNLRMVLYDSDGTAIQDRTVPIPSGASIATKGGLTTYPGDIPEAFIRNDTTGIVVWNYPSEAERVRLITKTNVRTDRGGFETVDASVISRIATQLDLRGAYAEKTFIADCWFPATTNNGTLNYFPMITQGDGLSGSGSSLVVNLSVQADYRASAVSRRLQLTWADASGSVHTTNVVVSDAFFGKRHRIVGVIRPGASSAQYTNELYIDGELVGRGSGSVSSFVFGKAAAASIAPGNLHLIERDYTGFLSQSSLLYGALIFDRALSAEEIALYSKIANS